MTATVPSAPRLASRLVNTLLAVKPLANLAKQQARQMMIKRAESIGVYWTKEVEALQARDWQQDLAQVQNAELQYPEYYVRSFHAYEEGNLGWQPAWEVEVAAQAVHARIWKDAGAEGDARLRQSYHDILKTKVSNASRILDMGCSVGISTFALKSIYPNAQITGVDLSPYFLAVANHQAKQKQQNSLNWLHAAAESTGLPDNSFDLVSAFLVFHELPASAALAVIQEAHRLLRPGGHFALMDMNPQSEIFTAMPPYVLTLLKSTEPYLDEYFGLDLKEAIVNAGFEQPTFTCNSPRHRTVIAQVEK